MDNKDKLKELFDNEKYDEVVALCNSLIDTKTDLDEAYFFLGSVEDKNENYKKAIELYSKTIEINSKYREAYLYRAYKLAFIGDNKSAIKDCSRVLKITKDDLLVIAFRGDLYTKTNQYNKAVEDYTKIINLINKNGTSYYLMGDAILYTAYSGRAKVYSKVKKYIKAIEDYSQIINMDNNAEGTYFNRGYMFYTLKQYQRAIDDYTKAIELDDKYVNAYINRGCAYRDLKQYESALKDFEKVYELDPSYHDIKNGIDWLKSKLNENE